MDKEAAFLLLVIFAFSFASAAMEINEPSDVYNLGEKLYVSVTGIVGSDEGNLNINLVCLNETVNLLKISARAFSSATEQSYSLPYKILTTEDLEITNISNIVGKCNLIVSLNSQTVKSKTFEITSKVILESSLNKLTYAPGETITLDISATDANGKAFVGQYETNNFSVQNGNLINSSALLQIPTNPTQKAGTYTITILVYDTDSKGDVLNSNNEVEYFVISQKATSIELTTSDVEITPADKLTISPELFDQSGETMDETLTIYLESPNGEVRNYQVESNDYYDIKFNSSDIVGVWKVYAFFGSIFSDKYEFTMGCLPNLEYDIVGGLLAVTNTGNCVYDNILNISVAERDYSFNLSLNAGETIQYNLQAPDGDYDISISSDSGKFERKTFLTGNTVTVKRSDSSSINLNWLWAVAFLLIVFGGFFYVQKQSKGGGKNSKEKKKKKFDFKKMFCQKKKNNKKDEPKEEFIQPRDISLNAESTLVLEGEKMNSSVIAIQIKNNKDLPEETRKKVVELLKETVPRATLDRKDDFIFVIFNPLITKTYKNDMTAVQAALKIVRDFTNYNRKFSIKIQYGISVHSGDMIAEKDKDILKYTGVGDLLVLSRKMASISNEKLYVSDIVRKKLIRDLKVIKETRINNQDVYSVSEIKDMTANKEKLDDIMKRMNN